MVPNTKKENILGCSQKLHPFLFSRNPTIVIAVHQRWTKWEFCPRAVPDKNFQNKIIVFLLS
jgi:hypothetical protein